MNSNSTKGMVFDIQHFSIHDGPGIRTTVFLKGCPLRCSWCHNPESWLKEPQIAYDARSCLDCGYCVEACPKHAHSMANNKHLYNRELCNQCGQCAAACPSKALELSGEEMTVETVMDKVLSDKAFYLESGGGLTVSGGEPLMQADFTASLLTAARSNGIHTAVETSGAGSAKDMKQISTLADLILFDIKASPTDYQRLTGIDFAPILANLSIAKDSGCALWLRLPLIPGMNDTEARLSSIAKITEEFKPARVETIPYHQLGTNKRTLFN